MSDLADKKITQSEIDAVNVKSVQGSRLRGTVQENKNVFDRLAEFISARINEILDVLTLEGASNISFEEVQGLVATTVQDAIEEVFDDLETHIGDKNNPHETTAAQVSEDVYGNVQAAVLAILGDIAAEEHNRVWHDDLLRDDIVAVSDNLTAHKGDFDNPHRVTSDQIKSVLFGTVEKGLSELASRILAEAEARAAGDAKLTEAIEDEAEARVSADIGERRARLAEEAARKAQDKFLLESLTDMRKDLEAFMCSFGVRTWQDVLNDFPTWQDVLGADTWLKVQMKAL
jgi:hypothetical protein